jgi:H+-translocating NAD(P) transhydrogenase subunit beta
MSADLAALCYLIAGALFIMALRGLSNPETSRRGNLFGMLGMTIAVVTTLAAHPPADAMAWILVVAGMAIGGGAGAVIARRVPMTSMPELVAAFHSLFGMAAVLVAAGALYAPEAFGIGSEGEIHRQSLIEMSLGVAIGAITFTGSVIAFLKLSGRMSGKPILLPARHAINIALAVALVALVGWFFEAQQHLAFWLIAAASFLLGVLIIVPIGGADMPVVISMLNSYSGWAAAGIGFTLGNSSLIVTGALVGSSGAILSYIMCKGMNRSFISVILGGFGGEVAGPAAAAGDRPVKIGSAEDAGFILKNAGKVIIVPGYGLAAAQAQHEVAELADVLESHGVDVSYAIHPVAGRMPGHMNVLLAEANVPYPQLKEMDDVNPEFARTDVALVIGANDVTNPAARRPGTAISGMPILDVDQAKSIIVIKRSMGHGYAGIDNELYTNPKTSMYFADAKTALGELSSAVKTLVG